MSIDAASRSTRIRPRYLAALEDDAGTDSFPGPVYARFFLKEYARYLGVDDEPLVVALEERTPPPPAPLGLVGELQPPRRWVGHLIRLAAIAAMVGLVAYTVVTSGTGSSRPPAEGLRSGLTRVPAFGHGTHAGVAAPRAEAPIRATLVVLSPTHVEVLVDGEKAVKRTVQPRRMTFRAVADDPGPPSIALDVDDGSAVTLTIDGRPVRTDGRSPFHARYVASYGRTVRL